MEKSKFPTLRQLMGIMSDPSVNLFSRVEKNGRDYTRPIVSLVVYDKPNNNLKDLGNFEIFKKYLDCSVIDLELEYDNYDTVEPEYNIIVKEHFSIISHLLKDLKSTDK